MSTSPAAPPPPPVLPRDLGDGLVLRNGRAADAHALAAFNADVLRAQDGAEPFAVQAAWTRDLMTGRHPTFRPEDALIVEATRTGAIVSSMMLIRQTWSFGGVPIAVGQPELCGTLPEYRERGLVRRMFEVAHAWSAARGDHLNVINGVPWFYRQFGYEMAIAMGGGPALPLSGVPRPAEPLSHHVRPLTAADLPFAAALEAAAARRYLVTVPRDEALWRYELDGRDPGSGVRQELRTIETVAGEPLGYLAHGRDLIGTALRLNRLEIKAGVSWRAVWPALLAYLWSTGEACAARDPKREFGVLGFWLLGPAHPLYRVVRFLPVPRTYAWYVRVPSLSGFLKIVAPVLERRLAESLVPGHTGELRLGFYRSGLRLNFKEGRLISAATWRPDPRAVGLEFSAPSTDERRATAMFPDLTFLQLLFGFRSLEELEVAFPDCQVRTGEARALIDALFPKQASAIWPVL